MKRCLKDALSEYLKEATRLVVALSRLASSSTVCLLVKDVNIFVLVAFTKLFSHSLVKLLATKDSLAESSNRSLLEVLI